VSGFVYIQTEKAGAEICPGVHHDFDLFTVGFYNPDGKWNPVEDFNREDAAKDECSRLNGQALLAEFKGELAVILNQITDLLPRINDDDPVCTPLRETLQLAKNAIKKYRF
jgi:hypothetical protein